MTESESIERAERCTSLIRDRFENEERYQTFTKILAFEFKMLANECGWQREKIKELEERWVPNWARGK